VVVSCKAWQSGFDPAAKLAEIAENKIIWQESLERLPRTLSTKMV
jgi:hypothetical protein